MKRFKTIVSIAFVAISLNSCLSMKFAEKVNAQDEYPGEFFEDDTFSVTVKNVDDKKTKIRVVDRTTNEEMHKIEIGPNSQVEVRVRANDVILISKRATVEYKFELTGE